MKEIVVINGSGGVGKDTFVEFCREFTSVMNISSVDKVKEAASVLAGWNGEKDEKSRKFLSDLKDLGIKYNNAPLRYISNMAEEFEKSENQLMFVHIRESEEIEKCKNKLKAKTLLITNKNVGSILTNVSDRDVDKYQYDYHISNDGTLEELREKAKEFVTLLTEK